MSREWKPGDVALLRWDYDGEMIGLRIASSCPVPGHPSAAHWHTSRGTHGEHPDLARPLVVIDPEDRERVERLRVLYHEGRRTLTGSDPTSDMQDALRAIADPKPPRPEEPTGLGAVVEDAGGRKRIRVGDTGSDDWRRAGFKGGQSGRWYRYDEIDVVRILSPGYDPEATT